LVDEKRSRPHAKPAIYPRAVYHLKPLLPAWPQVLKRKLINRFCDGKLR
jgi:hypothetical protein